METPVYGVRRLMRLMEPTPIYQKSNTSKAAKGHKIYPYLSSNLRVDRPNQVWAADNHPPWFIGSETKQLSPTSRGKK